MKENEMRAPKVKDLNGGSGFLNGGTISQRIEQMNERIRVAKEIGTYPYMLSSDAVSGIHVTVNGRPMLQFASYSYLDLLGHPRINAAAERALREFGTGTHGVRFLSGTTRVHVELERTIARFKNCEDAIALSSGYATNFGTISALISRNDVVISDKLNHASIVDGCLLSRAHFVRFEHNDMEGLERALAEAPKKAGKLVITDAVFSMDGDVIHLPEMIRLCRKYAALLMVDEAHSLGVLGKTGRGIEEHFGIDDPCAIDIKMGTLSKTIPSVGGYIAGSSKLISYLKHTIRPFIFSAALSPAAAVAAKEAFDVIEAEPERVIKLQENAKHFIQGLRKRGFNTLNSTTPIVPIIAGEEEKALMMAKISRENGVFAVPILTPAVLAGTSRIRATVTSGHSPDEIERAMDIFENAGKTIGILSGSSSS